MKGGITIQELKKLKRKEFTWMMKRLTKQIKAENDAVDSSRNTGSPAPTDKRRYLGKL